MKRLLVLLFVFLAACARPQIGEIAHGATPPLAPVLTFHMDTDFTPQERADASEAATLWNKQTGGVARLTLVFDLDFNSLNSIESLKDSNVIVRAESGMNLVTQADESSGCSGCVLGWMTSGGIHNVTHDPVRGVFVADRLDDASRLQVMLHEFGHALGLPHIGSRQAIMYPSLQPGKSSCLKKPDLVAFCEVNECGSAQMVPCE